MRKNKGIMSCKCGNGLEAEEIRHLKENDYFTDRTLYIANCDYCTRINVLRLQTDKDGTTHKKHAFSSEARRILKQEKSKVLHSLNLAQNNTCGLCYGLNKEIKNKKGEVTQIRQYACDFNNQRDLVKKVSTK